MIDFPNGSSGSTDSHKPPSESEAAGFILKTYEMLGVKVQQFQKIIFWGACGQEFIIKDCIKLEEIVLPRYFRHNKLNSFVRQLNMYGFHKIKHTACKSTFRHKYFLKDRHDLLSRIKRRPKNADREEESNEETRLPQKEEKSQLSGNTNSIVEAAIKQEQQTIENDKWRSISQQFLGTTRMINMSLVKVTCNELTDFKEPIQEEDDCVSIEDDMKVVGRLEGQLFFDFQNPSCFFASHSQLSQS